MWNRRFFFSFTVFTLVFLAMFRADSSHGSTRGKIIDAADLTAAIAGSSFIFSGRVKDVRFRLSDGDPDAYTVVPLTYVTYEVDSVLRGERTGDTFTLRFLGGATSVDGRYMHLPNLPLFKIGDRDILIVSGNGQSACPLVNCTAGRYRIIGDKVFNDVGFPVVSLADQRISLGPAPLEGNHIATVVPAAPVSYVNELRDRLASPGNQTPSKDRARLEKLITEVSAPRTITMRYSGKTVSVSASSAVSPDEFLRTLRAIASDTTPPEKPVVSVTFDQEVLLPLPKKGNLRVGPPSSRTPLTDEQRLLEQNDGNPVIPRQ